MKRKKVISLALTGLLGLSGGGLLNGRIVKADTTGGSIVGVTYRGQVQNIGWQPYVSDGAEAGTDGKGFRVEALNIKLVNAPAGASIQYQGHVQNIGWQQVVSDGAETGTDGKGLRVEAFKLALAGMPGYSVEYRAHVQNIGWQPWVSDGAEAGTDGKGLRVEALEIKIVKTADGSTPVPVPFVDTKGNHPIIWTNTGGTTGSTGITGTTGSTGGTTTATSGNSTVTFKDANLEAQVRIAIKKPTGTLYKSDVADINSLDIQSGNITDLSGIETLTGLTTLFLSNDQISDISPLKGLTNLTDLDLSGDKISNISPLKGLTNLTRLNLSNNKISDADEQALKEALPKCTILLASTSTTDTGTSTTPTTTNIIPAGISITVTTARSIQVKFSSAPVDTSKVIFNVTGGGNVAPLSTSWDSTNTVATIVYDSNLPADTYVVDVKDGTTDLGSGNISVKAPQIAKIKIMSTILGVIADNAYASYQVLDQYGDNITMTDLAKNITWTCGIGNISANRGTLTIVPFNGRTLTQYTSADIKGSADNGVSISATLDVAPGMSIIPT